MEEMCLSSEVHAVEEIERDIPKSMTINNDSGPRCISPILGSVTAKKKVDCVRSPDDDSHSCGIISGMKRFSFTPEYQESILPITPVNTTLSVKKLSDFQTPLIHTIASVVKKNGRFMRTLEEENEVDTENMSEKFSNAFENLGMVDEDISWNTQMETPAPQQVNLNNFNTIERATFLPESDLKNMQPRALFSPHKHDDTDCIPLKYSSESDDESVNNSTKMQSSYECGPLSNRNMKDAVKEGINLENKDEKCDVLSPVSKISSIYNKETVKSPQSPIFRVNKSKNKSKRLKAFLVKSPLNAEDNKETENLGLVLEKEGVSNFDAKFPMEVNTNRTDLIDDKGHFSEQSNSIQDDSFQNMSFSQFDELCKSSASVNDCNGSYNTNSATIIGKETVFQSASESEVSNLPLVEEKIDKVKFFYSNTNKYDELHPVPSEDVLFCSAKILEEDNLVPEKKTQVSFGNKKLTVFSKILCENPEKMLSVHKSTKRTRQERSSETLSAISGIKKMKLNEKEETEIDLGDPVLELNENEIENSQFEFDGNNTQICLTAAYAESLIHNDSNTGGSTFTRSVKDISISASGNYQECGKLNENISLNFPMFSTASGTAISVSNEMLSKAKAIFGDDYEDNFGPKPGLEPVDEKEESKSSNSFQGFKTASGASIKLSEKSLSKAKNLFRELDVSEGCFEADKTRNSQEAVGFTTASGMKVKISEESLNKAKEIFHAIDFTDSVKIEEKGGNMKSNEIQEERSSVGFKTASNKTIEVSKESLKKVHTLWREEEILGEQNFGQVGTEGTFLRKSETDNDVVEEIRDIREEKATDNARSNSTAKKIESFCGFSTASDQNVDVSMDALTNARKVLGQTELVKGANEEENYVTETTEDGRRECNRISPKLVTEKHFKPIPDNDEENPEYFPFRIHVYTTSPTLTMDRMHLEAVTSHEDCRQHSTPRERYLVRSPVLGTTDRFYDKRKRRNPGRKLVFDSSPMQKKFDDKQKLENIIKPNFVVPYRTGLKTSDGKRESPQLTMDFTVPFKRRRLEEVEWKNPVVDEEKPSELVEEERKKARELQVKMGIKGKVRPIKGSHLRKKSEVQMSLLEAVGGAFPQTFHVDELLKYGVKNDVLQITAFNAADYKFKSTDFYSSATCFNNVNGLPAGDDCLLIFDDENKAGVEDFTRSFFASSGVEPKLISEEWVKNHYKWIVWKLSHYERSFPKVFGGRCLTPHNVLVQLKYRYDREINRSHRSALKKILERDESPARKMVLCVCDIIKGSELESNLEDSSLNKSLTFYKLGLTDGWYSCYAQTDSALVKFIEEGKVMIGTKLVTQGAELLNCDKGISPLEAADGLHLKIATNSTRRARWWTKLGFQNNGGPLLVPLNSILPNGGLVGRIDIVIVRIYPVLYMEKKSDGTHVTRNGRAEDKAAAAYQQQQEVAMEKIYQEVKKEIENKEKMKGKGKPGAKLSVTDISHINDAEELYKIYENYSDPSAFQNLLTAEQKDILVDYQQRKTDIANKELADMIQEKVMLQKMNTRKVSQLFKMKIVDLRKPDYSNPAVFTVWNSTEDVLHIFSEGKALSIFSTMPSSSRFFKTAQLNSTRQTYYRELTEVIDYPARKLTHLSELDEDFEPVFNEVDMVGIVVFIQESAFGSRLSQTVFIADLDFNFTGIVFWGSCKDYGWENILTVKSVVACSNLQFHKKRNSFSIPSVFVSDSSVFTENPKQIYLKEEVQKLRMSLPGDMKSFVSDCENKIKTRLEEHKDTSNLSKNSSVTNDTSVNLSSSDRSTLSTKPKYVNGFKTKPSASSTPFKSVCLSLDTGDQEPSPIQKKIEKLMMYGEPPPLSPLLPLNNIHKFRTKFRVPVKNSPPSDSVAK